MFRFHVNCIGTYLKEQEVTIQWTCLFLHIYSTAERLNSVVQITSKSFANFSIHQKICFYSYTIGVPSSVKKN